VLSMDGTGTVFGYLLSALALLIYASLRTSPNRSLTKRTNRALLPFYLRATCHVRRTYYSKDFGDPKRNPWYDADGHVHHLGEQCWPAW
jgi:hypothetical protein